jgi:phage replication O-like protein O
MNEVLGSLYLQLSKVNLGAYEWRVLMVIMAKTVAEGEDSVTMKLDEIAQATSIPIPHISRAMSALIQRNIIQRVTFKGTHNYSLSVAYDLWRSSISVPSVPMTEDVRKDFEAWWDAYPKHIYKEDTRILYAHLVLTEGVAHKELMDSLIGYYNYEKDRSRKMKREMDSEWCLYPTTYLRNNRWREFMPWMGYKRKPKL